MRGSNLIVANADALAILAASAAPERMDRHQGYSLIVTPNGVRRGRIEFSIGGFAVCRIDVGKFGDIHGHVARHFLGDESPNQVRNLESIIAREAALARERGPGSRVLDLAIRAVLGD